MQRFINSFAALAIAAALFITVANAQEKLPIGPGRETMKRVCGACHSAENVAGMAKTREEWGAVVGEMAADGAQGTEDEFNEIVDYLATYFPKTPKINVNKATAKDLESGLELPAKEADAIVHFREEKGSFKSIEDVEKVPGVDAKKIEAKKDRLVF
ncbi:MAG TPA: helix-hairpin-helix domain-containing protein [Bryobacteraceae bacterium]|nr:helix-hairpin-helix domain-containing protein [Bryobacteraceae bacterium]